MNGSLDTNVVLRYLLEDVPEQSEAVKKLLEKKHARFAVADTVFIELAFVMNRAYGMSRDDIAMALRLFSNLGQINCNRVLLDQALPLFISHPALSFEDCCLVTYAVLNDALPLYTFDKKLANQVNTAQLLI